MSRGHDAVALRTHSGIRQSSEPNKRHRHSRASHVLNERFLVVIETQRVKTYLLASPYLRETRGASLLLDRLNRADTQELVAQTGGELIYLGGGSGRVVYADRPSAENFAERVRDLYRRETVTALVSVEVVERDPNELFPEWMARGVARSQANKLGRVESVPSIAGRWIRPCTSCGLLPAEEETQDVQGIHRVCLSCHIKRQLINDFYRNVKHNRHRRLPVDKPLLRTRFPKFVLTDLMKSIETKWGADRHTLCPQDFDQIAACSRSPNHIGFIYADGNRMGEVVKTMARRFPDDHDARRAYSAFSTIVDQATREAAVLAVLEVVGTQPDITLDGQPAQFVPAEFVLAAGDDLILVVPGDTAIEAASRFISEFQKRTIGLQHELVAEGTLNKEFAPAGITISAGVVIAHATYPASQLLELVGDLMKLAKRKAADLAPAECVGTLDFMVLHESGSAPAKYRRQHEYTRMTNGRTVLLTERPYTAAGAEQLIERIRALRHPSVPRSALNAIYPALFQNVAQAQFDALTILQRLKATGALTDGSPLQLLREALPLFPFREDEKGQWVTSLSEIVELFDFVRGH